MIEVNDLVNYLNENGYSVISTLGKNRQILGFSSITKPAQSTMVWYRAKKQTINAEAEGLTVITDQEIAKPRDDWSYVVVSKPKNAFFSAIQHFFVQEQFSKRSDGSVIESNMIGNNFVCGANSYIGPDVVIGDDVYIGNNVSIEGRCTIGNRVIIASGAVIGGSGFGYFKDENGANHRIVHSGGVQIGDDVDIGANTCIDKGTIDDTFIGNRVKIDNLCHIAHNVIIDDDSMITAMSMIAGSVHLEESTYVAPGVLIMNQVTVGRDSFMGIGTVVTKDVAENKVIVGVPGKVLRDNLPN